MSIESGGVNDPIRRLMEWQNHRYDIGYYLGGRIHPILLGRRPNKFGYLLIIDASASSLAILGLALSDPFGSLPVYILVLALAYRALELSAGLKLIQRPLIQEPPTEFQDDLDSVQMDETGDDEGYGPVDSGTINHEGQAVALHQPLHQRMDQPLNQPATEPEPEARPSPKERKSRRPYARTRSH